GPSRSSGRPGPRPDPDPAVPLLDLELGERGAHARAREALPGVGAVARAVLAAHQRVVLVVEEPGIAEIERKPEMPAGVEVGVEPALVAHHERLARHAVEGEREAEAFSFGQPFRVGEHQEHARDWPNLPGRGKMAPRHAARSRSGLAGGASIGPSNATRATSRSPVPPPRPLIAVFGSSTVKPGEGAYQLALDLGRELACAGAEVMTGGYGGAMEACSK